MRVFISLAGLVLTATLLPSSVTAQVGHYWTIQFGSRSTLLGGAVVGSKVDASANYYNPGAVGLMEDETLLQSTAVYRWESLTVDNNYPEVETEGYSSIDRVPNFTGGILETSFLGAARIGYSIFSRHSFKIDLEMGRKDSLNAVDRFEGKELYSAFSSRELKVNDSWYGFTLSYRIGENIGVGISPFLSVRRLSKFGQTVSSQAFSDDNANATSSLFRDYSFTVYSLIFKFGMYYEFSSASLGFSVTTPGLRLSGSGSAFESATALNQDVNGDGSVDTVLESQVLSGVSASYPTPLAIAIGASLNTGSWTWYITSEWYSDISPFNPFEYEPIFVLSEADVYFADLSIETRSVVNFAVGIEKRLSETSRIFLSGLTDTSSIPSNEGFSLSVAGWDLFHVTTGASFNISRLALTAGVGYVYGTDNSSIPLNFVEPHESNYLRGENVSEKVRYRGIKFILGIEFGAKPKSE